MRVEFSLTADDRIAVVEYKYLRGRFRRVVTLRKILLCGTLFAVSLLLGRWLGGKKPASTLVGVVVGFVYGAGIVVADGFGLLRSSFVDCLRKKTEDEGQFRCVVTIDESGVASSYMVLIDESRGTATWMDVDVFHPWSAVEFVDDCELGAEIAFRDGELLVVWSAGERKSDIIEQARRYLAERGSATSQAQA